MDFKQLLPLRCSVQHYHWGTRMRDGVPPFIAALQGETPEDDTPYAELWVGAHPSAPSVARHPNGTTPLNGLIEESPKQILGEIVMRQLGPKLPFLLKVLSCRQPLSIQAHPDRETAERMHQRDPEHFPDGNHKPEIAVALEPFELLSGFRSAAEVAAEIEARSSLSRFFRGHLSVDCVGRPADWLLQACERVVSAPDNKVTDVLEGLALELTMFDELADSDRRFLEALEHFPGDRGSLFAYLLRSLQLQEGEAVYTAPGIPHSYFHGTIVECMASSDNVVRAGLTPKHIDREALLGILDYAAEPQQVFAGETAGKGLRTYTVPAEEFQIDMISGDQDHKIELTAGGAVSLMVVLQGHVTFETSAGEVDAPRGSAWLWPADLPKAVCRIQETPSRVVRARPNVRALLDSIEVVDLGEDETTQDFGAMLAAQTGELKEDPQPGEKVTGRVTAVDRNSVFVDLGAKSEGVLDVGEFTDKDGALTVQTGDTVEAYCLSTDEERIRLTCRMTGEAADGAMREAYESAIPVEGRVTAERKGGFAVKVGHQEAFCPYSQIDIARRDAGVYIGETFTFLVTEYSEGGRNIVLSRRRLLEQERQGLVEELKQALNVGDIVTGEVRRVMDFGAFVDIGGMEGLVPVSEFTWGHVDNPQEFLREGETVQVQVREIDWERERISLSLKRAGRDPWEDIEGRYVVGATYEGTVTRLAPFGAFVQLEPGIEGLVHISKLGAGRRINHPSEVVEEGQDVEVSVEAIEPERHRIGLSMEQRIGGGEGKAAVNAGNTVTGMVDGIQDYGVFVKLPDGRTGLLHASRMDLPESGNQAREIEKKYKIGQEVSVVVEAVDGDRLALSEPGEEEPSGDALKDTDGGNLGSLGGLFDGLEL
ncbi:MAG: mannose-6-phosphate isomerase, class I [Verrucomicrobiota bacterium]